MSEGFSDQILGGVGTLIRKFIRSKNYVTGSAGWQITSDGNAEFNNLTARGSTTGIIVGGPVGTNPEIKMDVTPEIIVYNATGAIIAIIDSTGINVQYTDGSFARLSPGGGAGANVQLSPATPTVPPTTDTWQAAILRGTEDSTANHKPILDVRSPQNQSASGRFAEVQLRGQGHDLGKTLLWVNADETHFEGPIYLSQGIDGPETWHKVTGGIGYQNGYTDRGGIYAPVQYKLTLENEVKIVGSCTGTFSAGVIIFTLPIGYRPNKTIQAAIQGNGTDSVIEVNADGTCKLFNCATGAIGINGRFPLDTLA